MLWLDQILECLEDSTEEERRTYHLYYSILAELTKLLSVRSNGATLMEDNETPTDKAPIICPLKVSGFDQSLGVSIKPGNVDRDALAHNDDALVRWFATTSLVRLEQFRKFQIPTGYTNSSHGLGYGCANFWHGEFSHCETLTIKDFVKNHGIS